MYVSPNFKTKKQLKEAIAAGKEVFAFQPGPFGGNGPINGEHSAEGPHYPKPHKWYARITVVNSIVTKVK